MLRGIYKIVIARVVKLPEAIQIKKWIASRHALRACGRKDIFLFFFLLLLSSPTFAIPADDAAEIHITSDQFAYDHHTGVATYTGDVLAVQGTRKLTGDEMQVYRAKDGKIAKIITTGKQAKYQGIMEHEKPMLYARANTIIYNIAENHLTLLENAHVKQGGDVYESPRIEYDTLQKVVKSPPTEDGRTTIILQPQHRDS